MGYEQKARLGMDHRFVWVAPKPTAAAELEIAWAAGAEGVSLENAPPLSVTDHDPRDANILTVATAPDEAHFGPAFLMTKGLGVLSVRVVSLDAEAKTVTLAEPLPRTYRPEDGDQVIFSTFSGTVAARSECERDVRYTVLFEHLLPGASAYPYAEAGTIHVVIQPFETGLTSEEVSRKLANLGTPPAAAQGWDDVIESALDELIALLRARLAPLGLVEDDIQAPQALRMAHLSMVAAHHMLLTDPETSRLHRELAREQVDQYLKRVHLDTSRVGLTPHSTVTSIPRVESHLMGRISRPLSKEAL